MTTLWPNPISWVTTTIVMPSPASPRITLSTSWRAQQAGFFTPTPWPRPTLDDYLGQLRTWQGWLERYPTVTAVLTHGFPRRLLLKGRRLRLPGALLEPFRAPSARLQLLFHISLGDVWKYPYLERHTAIAHLVGALGSERLMWGMDGPNVEPSARTARRWRRSPFTARAWSPPRTS